MSSSLDRIKKRRQQLEIEKSNLSSNEKSLAQISLLRDEISRTGKIDYGDLGDLAPMKSRTKTEDISPIKTNISSNDYSSMSSKELYDKRQSLVKQANEYSSNKTGDNFKSLKGIWNLLSGKTANNLKEDKEYQKLQNEISNLSKAYENKLVEEKTYDKGVMGGIEKGVDTFVGNAQTGVKGVETTFQKILGKTPDKNSTEAGLNERIAQKARQETTGAGGVALDVVGSIGRMTPQLFLGNPFGATAMGFANYGGGAYNQAIRDGYDDEKATKYGLAIGTMEMAMTKALGSFGDVYGKTKLGNASQGLIDKVIPKLISNKQLRNVLSQFISEGTEEFLQEYTENIAKDVLLDEKGLLKSTWENVTDTDVLADALYSGFVGGITGSTMAIPGQIDAYRYEKRTGRSAETGLTTNEQSVMDNVVKNKTIEKQKQAALDTEVNKIIAEQEKTFGKLTEAEKTGIKNQVQSQLDSGKIDYTTSKLSKKEITEIEKQVRDDLEKGYIDIDTIESTLGGEEYQNYKNTQDKVNKIENEIKELESKKMSDMNVGEWNTTTERLNSLREELKAIDTNTSKSNLDAKMSGLISSNELLQRSYQEKANRSVQFQADINKYTGKQRETIQKAIDSGILNNTNKTHEFVDMVAKLSADKGVSFDFTNNTKLKDSGFAIKGKQVNGYVNQNGITVNIDSKNALNSVVGHEITHVLEGTDVYNELQAAVKEYATTKGVYDTKLAELTEMYKGVDGVNVENELTSDLVGEYLFTDTDFVNNLSATKPNVFKKIYNEIKYMLKVATAGSKEARQLEKVKKTFEEAYRNSEAKLSKNTEYSISDIDFTNKEKHAINKWGGINSYFINDYLRKNAELPTDANGLNLKEISDNLSSALNKIPAYEGKVYRSIPLEGEALTDFLNRYQEGNVVTEDAFTSASVGEVYDDGWNVQLEIQSHTAKDTTELFRKEEHEVLFDKGSKFKVLEVDTSDPNKIKIKAEDVSDVKDSNAKYLPSEVKPLEQRVSGDALLDAQDFIEEIKSVGANVDENGYVTVYHQTSTENAVKIKQSGKMTANEDYVYFSTSKNAQQADGRGQTKLEFKIPAEKLLLDDIFSDNADVKVPLKGNKALDVSDYLVNDTKYSLSENNDLNKYIFNDEFYNQFQYEDKTKITQTIEELKTEKEKLNPDNNDEDWTKNYHLNIKIKALENGYNSEYDYIVGREKERLTRDYEYGRLDKQIEEKKRLEAKNNQLQQDIKDGTPFKNAQYQIIQETNPMFDEEHVGIRSPKDIKTFEEVINDEDSFTWGDYSKEDALRDLKKGTVTLYSSYPIKNGTFVSTSYQQALEYAGGDPTQVHSRKAALDSVAWINGDEGQYAKVYNYSLSNQDVAPTKQTGNIYGEDVRLEEQIAPLKDTIDNLTQKVNDIAEKMDKQLLGEPVTEADLPMLEQQRSKEFSNIEYNNEPDTTYNDETVEIKIKSKKDIVNNIRENFNITAKDANALYNKIAGQPDITLEDIAAELSNYSDFKTEYTDPNVKALKRIIRNTKIDMSYLKNQITDYNNFRKSNMGKLRLGNTGTQIDTFYEELSNMYPAYLDPEIITEADQLEALSDFMNNDHNLVDEYTIDNETINNLANQIYTEIGNSERFKASEKQYRQTKKELKNLTPPVENASNKIDIKDIEPIKNDGIAPVYKDPTKASTYDEIAEILESEPKKEDTRNKRKWAIFKASVLDKGSVFEDLSLKTKNRELMSKWDYTLTSQARAQNVIGEGHYAFDPETKTQKQTSKSLNAIREEVDNTGLTKEFSEYIYHKHNVDRMNLEAKAQEQITKLQRRLNELTSDEDIKAVEKEIKELEKVKNKPVFGYSVTSDTSQRIVNNYEQQHPEFIDFANDVYEYLKADRQELVKEGVISQETANLWQEMYPHYVPIRRVDSKGVDINVPLDTGRTGINAPIKKATGGNTDILPLFDTMAMRTLQTYRATAKNSFGLELMNTLDTPHINENIDVDSLIDSVDNQDSLLQEGKNGSNPTFTVFDHGEKITYEITKDMYDALKPVSDSSFLSKTIKPLNVASSIHRGVLTQYNLFFALTNAVKDAQDVLINSQHAAKTYATVPEAWAQIAKKGYWYQEYMKHGGEQNSYFDSQDNTFNPEKKGLAKVTEMFPLKTIADINDFIEMTPRLSEYIASRKSGASIETAMLDAARVTTNFKAGGDFTKFLNRNGFTFLNASIQGFNQQVRNIREANAKGIKGWANLATKFAAAGLPALLLNSILWDDDDDYEELSDYVKENYYVVAKYGDGKFIRIPKGRTLAVIQNAMEQMQSVATGDDKADLEEFISLFLNNLAPNNPIENNILSPIIQAATNKSWYGGDLVPTRLQDMPAAEQYDESTDSFSKWLGEKLNVSPYKINYVLDQYTGFLGDMFMPMMTQEAKNDAENVGDYLIAPLKDKFTTDSVMKNQNTSELFETSEKLTTEAKKSNATDEDTLKNKFINAMKSEMNDLYKQKREIQNSNLPKSEKYNQVREIQKQINAISKSALNNYEDVKITNNYASVSDMEYYKHINSEDEEVWSKINSEEKDALNRMNMSDSDKNNYFTAKDRISGIVKEYKNNKNSLDDDEDSYKDAATTLSGDKKAEIINTIKNSGLNDEQKAYLYDKYYASTDKLNIVVQTGISMDSYLDLEAQNFQSDKNFEGETISGSKKKKVFDYINSTDLVFEQKVILAKMYYPSYDEYNYDIIDYLNNNDYLDFDSEVKILKTLGFKVSEDGTITWK
ncbi:MAG: hypothetical protein J6D28_04635 [Bacilli bacterium]|nr:hypothetical protein [Bacilli bacterium]